MSEENLENKPEVKEEAKQDENEELTKTEKELDFMVVPVMPSSTKKTVSVYPLSLAAFWSIFL